MKTKTRHQAEAAGADEWAAVIELQPDWDSEPAPEGEQGGRDRLIGALSDDLRGGATGRDVDRV